MTRRKATHEEENFLKAADESLEANLSPARTSGGSFAGSFGKRQRAVGDTPLTVTQEKKRSRAA
jgi:hypothetical protein